jgi:hypothetical protein
MVMTGHKRKWLAREGRRPFERFRRLGTERFQKIGTELLRVTPTSLIVQLIQDEEHWC